LPFEDGSFEAVVCNFGLGHFPRAEYAMAECVRVLRPGGRLAVSWWDEPSRWRRHWPCRSAYARRFIAWPTAMPRRKA
jgi:ubiquinone/menaquinone biosynthesis C-methylase UbiE